MIAMVLGGLYLGFATETYRRVVHKWRHKLIVNYGLEIIYWLTQTGLLFYVSYLVNDGEIRFYMMLACLLGFSMYIVLCMSWYRKLLNTMIRIVKVIVRWTIDCLHLLIVQPLLWLGALMLSILTFFYKIIKRLLYICLYPLIFLIKKYVPEHYLKKISQIPTFCSTMIRNIRKVWKKAWQKWR